MNTQGTVIALLQEHGQIIDIGQISQADRRRLNYLTIHGVVAKDKVYHFPIPKTRYRWAGVDK